MDIKKVSNRLESNMNKHGIVGLSAILVDKNDSSILNFGDRTLGDSSHPFTDDTICGLGSVSKIFTSILISILTLKGDFNLNGTIGDFLKADAVNEKMRDILVLDLVTHTSGLPRLPGNFNEFIKDTNDPYGWYGEEQLLHYLKSGELENPKGVYEYSNLGYGILGYLMTKSLGFSYETLLLNNLLIPLQMNETSVYHKDMDLIHAATGYNKKNEPVKFWDMNVLASAGGLISSPQDMLKFLKGLLYKESPIRDAVDLTFESVTDKMAFGWHKYNWFINMIGGLNDLWHNGMTGGFASFIEINKKRDRGFVTMFNKSIIPDNISYQVSVAMPCLGY